MMTVQVEMHAFGRHHTPDGSVPLRDVEIPDMVAFREMQGEGWEDRLLGATFHYGQNDFQPRRMPSVSVGDIIVLPTSPTPRRFVVMPTGFREVAADFQPPADDRGGMYTYGLAEALRKERVA